MAQTFFVDEDVPNNARLDSRHDRGRRQVARRPAEGEPEAKNQVAFADLIILNKTDLVSAAELGEVKRDPRINPCAELQRTERCQVALKRFWTAARSTSPVSWRSSRISSDDGHDHHHDHDHHDHHDHDHSHEHDHGLKHYHDEEMQSMSLRSDKPLVMMVVIGMVMMIVIVMMVMIVIFEEIRLEFEDTVEIERAAFQNIRQRHLAALGTMQFGIGIDAANPRFDFASSDSRTRSVLLSTMIGEGDLIFGLGRVASAARSATWRRPP